MKKLVLLSLLLWTLSCSSQSDSENIRFINLDEAISEEVLTKGEKLADQHFKTLTNYLGKAYAPTSTITIYLEGAAKAGEFPYARNNEIHLYRYGADTNTYWYPLLHELVHIFRMDHNRKIGAWQWPSYRFYEEGFASYLGKELDSTSIRGFPYFGFPTDLVVGQWLEKGDNIPLDFLRTAGQLNLRCLLQTYPMREAWFRYLFETYGKERVIQLAFARQEPDDALLQRLFGKRFRELALEWKVWQLKRYHNISNTKAAAKAYRQLVNRYRLPICEKGVDF